MIIAGRNFGDATVDINNSESIKTMFEKVGKVDAVVCTAGEAKWAQFNSMTEDDFYICIKNKLMGQINLVRLGKDYMNPRGSFTLFTGSLADHPVVDHKCCHGQRWNHSFVKAVSLADTAGLSFYGAMGMSMFVFAGDSQFVSLSLLASGTVWPMIVLTTFVVNLRHMLYSATMVPFYKKLNPLMSGRRILSITRSGFTSETFAIPSLPK